MKAPLILFALASATLAAPAVQPRITPQALASLQRQASPLTPPADAPAAPEGVTVERPETQSIIAQSTILHDGRNWTLVPKSAVIFLPAALKSRVDAKPVGRLLAWADFLTQNRNWITTNEVTFDQAAGNEPLPAERVEFWAKQDKVVVAVHQNGPISVRIAKPESTHTLTQK